MKLGIAIVFLGLFVTIASTQADPVSPGRPSSLEALARQPEARVAWSKEVGRLDSGESNAVVTALVVEDSTQRGHLARGLRIDFSQPDWKGTVYLEEGALQPLKKILDQLTLDIGRGSPLGAGPGARGFIGSCEFRDNPGAYPLKADYYYSGPDSPALRLFGSELPHIMFPGRTPAHLSEVLATAIDELKAH